MANLPIKGFTFLNPSVPVHAASSVPNGGWSSLDHTSQFSHPSRPLLGLSSVGVQFPSPSALSTVSSCSTGPMSVPSVSNISNNLSTGPVSSRSMCNRTKLHDFSLKQNICDHNDGLNGKQSSNCGIKLQQNKQSCSITPAFSQYSFNSLDFIRQNNGRKLPINKTCQVSRNTKRKAETFRDAGDAPPDKVFINEALMATRMQELHLDNNNLNWHPNLEEKPWYTHSQNTSSTLEIDDKNRVENDEMEMDVLTNKLKSIGTSTTLELCQELQLGLEKTKDLLPKVMLEELSKPCMQVVLWKAPGDFVKDIVPSSVMPSYSRADTMDVEADVDVMQNSSDNTLSQTLPVLAPSVWSIPPGIKEVESRKNLDTMDL